jgi:hypothetical protein
MKMMRIPYAEKDPVNSILIVSDFWRSFFLDTVPHYQPPERVKQMLHTRLAEYDAAMNDDNHHIEFANSEGATMFLLRWA